MSDLIVTINLLDPDDNVLITDETAKATSPVREIWSKAKVKYPAMNWVTMQLTVKETV